MPGTESTTPSGFRFCGPDVLSSFCRVADQMRWNVAGRDRVELLLDTSRGVRRVQISFFPTETGKREQPPLGSKANLAQMANTVIR